MGKQNCWEIKHCKREIGGVKTAELGICPAAEDATSNGYNSGKNGGRICWAIAGTFCGGKVQGEFIHKQASCMACEVFRQIKTEEGSDFKLMKSRNAYHNATK